MPKYYAQCGPVRSIHLADSPQHAALIALDRTLQTHAWIYDDAGLTGRDRHAHLMLEALLHLDPSVGVSERGFDRHDATEIGTPETVELWHALMEGASRLFQAAGLPPRVLVATSDTSRDDRVTRSGPRLPR